MGPGAEFTAEEISGCFSYYIDDYDLEGEDPDLPEVNEVLFQNFVQFELLNINNPFSENCITCGSNVTSLPCMDIEISGTERRLIQVEHCCKCDPATLYGRTENASGVNEIGPDGLPLGQEGNCTGKLIESVFATEEQIQQIVEGGGYFSCDDYYNPDGVVIQEVIGSYRLVTITDVYSYNDYSYKNIGFVRPGASCDEQY